MKQFRAGSNMSRQLSSDVDDGSELPFKIISFDAADVGAIVDAQMSETFLSGVISRSDG